MKEQARIYSGEQLSALLDSDNYLFIEAESENGLFDSCWRFKLCLNSCWRKASRFLLNNEDIDPLWFTETNWSCELSRCLNIWFIINSADFFSD